MGLKNCYFSKKVLISFAFFIGFFLCILLLCFHQDSYKKEEKLQRTKTLTSRKNHSRWIEKQLDQENSKLVEILRQNFLEEPSTKPYNLSTDPVYNAEKHSYAWPYIDKVLQKIFEGRRNGFFVEAGALDGEFLSNTIRLEMELNWTGLLIEPNALSYESLLRKNRKSWRSNTCLATKPYSYKAEFENVSEYKRQNLNQSSWIRRGASHLLGYTMAPIYDGLFASSRISHSTIYCFPLFSYLLALNRTEVDLIVLDVQGAEEEILSTIPFEKVRVKVFVVEHSGKDNAFDMSFKNFFDEKGFQLIQCYGEPDYIFILREEFTFSGLNVTSCNIALSK